MKTENTQEGNIEENYSEKGGKERNIEEQKKTRTRRTKQAK